LTTPVLVQHTFFPQAPYTDEDFQAALTRSWADPLAATDCDLSKVKPFYSCAGVFQWLNHLWTPTPGVQINQRNVDAIVSTHFKADRQPDVFTEPFKVPMDAETFKPMDHKGAMKNLAPQEFAHAMIQACARDVRAEKDDTTLRAWAMTFRTVSFDFVLLNGPLMPLYAFHVREMYFESGEQVLWTTMQRVQMVIREKHTLESKGMKMSAPKLSTHFLNSVQTASSSEKMSASFIDAALTIESRILTSVVARTILNAMDSKYGMHGPLNSVYKLQSIINRARTPSLIEWCMTSLSDSLIMGFLEPGECSIKKLDKLHCDVALLKYQFHEYLLGSYLDEKGFPSASKAKARAVLCSHASVRSYLTNYPTEPQVEISWQATMPASLTKFCEFVESVVFSDNHDTSLRTGIKYRKEVKDIMEYQLVKEDLEVIQELLEKEVSPTMAVVDPPVDPAGTQSMHTCLR
jgi:hypothetical protein